MSKFIYEMVTFEHVGPGFRVNYHFEDYFTSREAAVRFCNSYVVWLLNQKIVTEAVEDKYENEYHSYCVLWRVLNEENFEYIGIVRNMILN